MCNEWKQITYIIINALYCMAFEWHTHTETCLLIWVVSMACVINTMFVEATITWCSIFRTNETRTHTHILFWTRWSQVSSYKNQEKEEEAGKRATTTPQISIQTYLHVNLPARMQTPQRATPVSSQLTIILYLYI